VRRVPPVEGIILGLPLGLDGRKRVLKIDLVANRGSDLIRTHTADLSLPRPRFALPRVPPAFSLVGLADFGSGKFKIRD
jgi:hypothetical protein